MATSAATAVAAMAAKARREIAEHFDERNAFDPAHAIAYDPPTNVHRRQFDSLAGRGVILDTGDGRYWLDRATVRREEEWRKAASILMFKVLLIFLALAMAGVAIVTALGR